MKLILWGDSRPLRTSAKNRGRRPTRSNDTVLSNQGGRNGERARRFLYQRNFVLASVHTTTLQSSLPDDFVAKFLWLVSRRDSLRPVDGEVDQSQAPEETHEAKSDADAAR